MRPAYIVVLVLALTSLCGHLMGIVYLYHWGTNTAGMGINTAICLAILAAGKLWD